MFELGDRLLRRMHRDRADRRNAIGVFRPRIDRELVEGVTSSAAQFLVADIRREELAMGWIKNRKIEPHRFEPIMHQPRDERGREIDRVLDREAPPRGLTRATIEPLLSRHLRKITFAKSAQSRGPAL